MHYINITNSSPIIDNPNDFSSILDYLFKDKEKIEDFEFFKPKSKERILESIENMSIEEKFDKAIENNIKWLAEDCIEKGLDYIYIFKSLLIIEINKICYRYNFELISPNILDEMDYKIKEKITFIIDLFNFLNISVKITNRILENQGYEKPFEINRFSSYFLKYTYKYELEISQYQNFNDRFIQEPIKLIFSINF
jgi:hypothetical protein